MIFHFVADMIVNFSYKFKLSTQQWFYFHLIRRGFLCTALVKMRTRFSLILIIIRCNQSSQRYLCFNVEQKRNVYEILRKACRAWCFLNMFQSDSSDGTLADSLTLIQQVNVRLIRSVVCSDDVYVYFFLM